MKLSASPATPARTPVIELKKPPKNNAIKIKIISPAKRFPYNLKPKASCFA